MSVPALSGRIESVRTGRAREHTRPAWDRTPGATWTSAYVKDEAGGPVAIGPLGLEGDEQFETAVHGGPDKAVLGYAFDHYAFWRTEPGLADAGPGAFAENLTVSGLDERRLCVGDVLRTGTATLQISQPRGPCANIARRWNLPKLTARVAEVARAGWYLRVLEPGVVKRGDAMALVERPLPDWSVERVFRARVGRDLDRDAAKYLASCPQLSANWRDKFSQRLAGLDPE